MARRILFLDIDGTLIDHAREMRPSVPEAVRRLRAAGHLVYLCTGRARVEIPDDVMALGVDGVISTGGGFVEHHNELLFAHTMPDDVVRELEDIFERVGVEYMLQGIEAYPSAGLMRTACAFFGHASPPDAAFEEYFGYRGQAPANSIAKATFMHTGSGAVEAIREAAGDRVYVIPGSMPTTGGSSGEVGLRGVTKGAAIAELVEWLDMSLDNAVGIGDSDNDLEMLELVGLGIAMGNSPDYVKEQADDVTGSVDEDGVLKALIRHGLI